MEGVTFHDCPSCRRDFGALGTLKWVGSDFHCSMCGVTGKLHTAQEQAAKWEVERVIEASKQP